MSDKGTIKFKIGAENEYELSQILKEVYFALQSKGYNPINQIVGYIISGDPTYITSYNNARNLISRIDREDLLEAILNTYLKDYDIIEK